MKCWYWDKPIARVGIAYLKGAMLEKAATARGKKSDREK